MICEACETHHAEGLPCPPSHSEALAKIEELEAEIVDQVLVPVQEWVKLKNASLKLENMDHLWNSVWLEMIEFNKNWTGRPQDKFYEHFHNMKRLVMETLK